VNCKVRGQFFLTADQTISQAEAAQKAQALPEVQKWLKDESGQSKMVRKAIYVPGKIVSLVV
jgi:hypothetical protein